MSISKTFVDNEVLYAADMNDIVTNVNSVITTAAQASATANAAAQDISNTVSCIADEFSESGNYYPPTLVMYDGLLYRCTATHEASAWDAAHFARVTLDKELNAEDWETTQYTSYYNTHGIQRVAQPFHLAQTVVAGEYVTYAGGLYRNLTGVRGTDPSVDTTNWKYIPPVREMRVTNHTLELI